MLKCAARTLAPVAQNIKTLVGLAKIAMRKPARENETETSKDAQRLLVAGKSTSVKIPRWRRPC
jgi:hypothetical protein